MTSAYEVRIASTARRLLSRLPDRSAMAVVEFITAAPPEKSLRLSKPLTGSSKVCGARAGATTECSSKWTMIEADETVLAAIRAGAWGYVLKGAGREEIKRAVRSVADGQVVHGAGVAER